VAFAAPPFNSTVLLAVPKATYTLRAFAQDVAVEALPSKEPVKVYPPVIVLAYGSITNGVPVPVLLVPSAEAIPKIRNLLLC